MASYLDGTDVKLNIDLLGLDAQKVAYRVLSPTGEELVEKTDFTEVDEESDSFEITIPAECNQVADGNQREIRLVEIYIETSTGTVKKEEVYSIESETVLIAGVNSFQSYPEALMTALTLPSITNWNTADKNDRITAMIAARRTFGRLKFRYYYDQQNHIIDDVVNVNDITLLSKEEYFCLPQTFREALNRAQIYEADSLLDTGATSKIRELASLGVTRSEVYEAKISLGTGIKPYESTLCSRAMKELTRWLYVRRRLARTA